MPAKFTFICIVHSVTERDTTDYIVREATVILRRETNANLELKIISFFPKNPRQPHPIPTPKLLRPNRPQDPRSYPKKHIRQPR